MWDMGIGLVSGSGMFFLFLCAGMAIALEIAYNSSSHVFTNNRTSLRMHMKMEHKNRDGNRVLENGRLVYYKEKATREFWERLCSQYTKPDFYKPYQEGHLFEFEKIFNRHLPASGKILEAGCGTAQLVLALSAKGYDCYGLDYTLETLRNTQNLVGPLRLLSGDLHAIAVPDGAFDAIISIGVVEHNYLGPEKILKEMTRVLKKGGVMLISVPYFNSLRKWRADHGAYQDDVLGLEFYQYAFSRREFSDFIVSCGYEIEAVYSYSHQKTLSEELHWLKRVPASLRKLIMRLSKYVPYVNSDLGHMLMVIARKR